MMKNFVFSLFLLFPSLIFSQSNARRVLWIGNSYTYVNDLPNLLRQLALSGGDSLIMDSNTPGGYTFANHSSNAVTLQKLALNNNDFVILQAQSQEPSFPPTQVEAQTFPYAQQLDSLVHVGSACAKTVFYMTWGRKYGDTQNCLNYPPLCTFEGMNDRLRWAYKQMADENEALMSPVGMAWKASWEADSSINLWSSDNSHPSLAGSYLAACVFYATILEKNPVGLSYTAGIPTSQATFLQQIASNTVFDSLSTWNINRWDAQSSFTYNAQGNSISFTSTSQNANQYAWDFGDGQLSNEENPIHIYDGSNNSYVVQLIASGLCSADTSALVIQLQPNSIVEASFQSLQVFPNPANTQLTIKSNNSTKIDLKVFSSSGKLVKQMNRCQSPIILDIEDLATGMYQVVCSDGQNQKSFRVLKK
jgi:PKD repeat protein